MEQIYTTYKESYGRKTSFSGFLGFVKEKPLLIDDPIFSGEAVNTTKIRHCISFDQGSFHVMPSVKQQTWFKMTASH